MAPPRILALPPPGAVICDLDGTLVATVQTRIEAWLQTFAEFQIPADPEHVASLIGSDGVWLAERVVERAGRPMTADEAQSIDRRAGELYGELNTDPQPVPGVAAFLDAIASAAMPWAIATSSRPAQVTASVAALGLAQWPLVVDGLSVSRAKPEPDILLVAADRLGVPPDRCWCVGDARWDMLAAGAAGMTPIGVSTGSATADDLQAAGAIVIVGRLDELVEHLVPT